MTVVAEQSTPASSHREVEVARPVPVGEIDASTRGPLLFFFAAGAIWLTLASLLLVICSIKLHKADFLGDTSWLTLGRMRPAAFHLFLYGFASQFALGVLLWLLCRLGRNILYFSTTILIAAFFWNLAVLAGFLGILGGGPAGFEWLDFPKFVGPVLFVSYVVMAVCALVTFSSRRTSTLYVSQWYLLAALFWFPWIFSASNLLLFYFPVRGVVQAVVNAWYTNNFLALWLGAVSLASIYYFLPKLTNRPLYGAAYAVVGFWTYALFTNWAGLAQLVGGPIPRWMYTVSSALGFLLFIPLLCMATNWFSTLRGVQRKGAHISLRFTYFAALAFLVGTVVSVFIGFRETSSITGFTYAPVGRTYFLLFGFVAMALFGAVYFIVPRITNEDWPKPAWIRGHYLATAIGAVVVFAALTIGGMIQGFKWADPVVAPVNVVRSTIPFIGIATLGFLMLLIGQAMFAVNMFGIIARYNAKVRDVVAAFLKEEKRRSLR